MREKERQEQVAVLRKARAWLATGRQLRYCRWTPSEVKFLSTQQMWTSKPVIVLVNMGKGDYHSYMRRHAGGDKGNNDDHTDHGHSHHENNENNENNEDNEDNEKSNSTRSAGVDKAGHSNDQYHDGRGACRVDEKMRKNARDHNNRTSINTDHDDKAKGKAPKTKLVKRTAPAKLDAIMQEVQHWVDCNSMGSTVIPFSAAAESKLFDEYKKSDDGKEAAGGSRENGGDDGDLGGDCVSSSTSPAPLSSGYAGDTKAGCDDDNTAGDVVSKSKSRSSLLTHHPSSKLPKMIHAGYQAASLIHFFTVNTEVVRAWTIRKGTKAPRAARKMHYDLDKRFISTEVYNYLELLQYGRVQELKAAGKLRMQGKEYVVEDGDILRFKFHQSSKK